jgi:hypothetical protein
MNTTATSLTVLYNKIPRRHSIENVRDINAIVNEFETILINIEATNSYYEKSTSTFFDGLNTIRAVIKKSTNNKASKKSKDVFFDEASALLKDSIQDMMTVYEDGKRS